MSLITFRSSTVLSDNNVKDPSNIRNFFREGIKFVPGNTLELVSLSVTRELSINIITGYNDTLVWRLGDAECYSQHTVRIPQGVYTSVNFALAVKDAMNASTLIGPYKGGWNCQFTDAVPPALAYFTLSYSQAVAPTANFDTVSLTQFGELPQVDNDSGPPKIPPVILLTAQGTPDFNYKIDIGAYKDGKDGTTNDSFASPKYGYYGDKGIYADGGEVSLAIPPIENLDQVDFVTPGPLGIEVEFGITPVNSTWIIPSPALANGWVWEITGAFTGSPYYAYQAYNGFLGISDTTALDATLPTSWTKGKYLFDFSTPFTQGRFLNVADNSEKITLAGGADFTVTTTGVGYPMAILGLAENKLIKGIADDPDNQHATPNSFEDYGLNIGFRLNQADPLIGSTDISVSLNGMNDNTGILYPLPGWRVVDNVFDNINSGSWDTAVPATPAKWTAFTYATDHIRLRLVLNKIRHVEAWIAHDSAGDANWTEQVLLAESLTAVGAYGLNRIVEKQFPLRPVVYLSPGNQCCSPKYYLGGITDTNEIPQSIALAATMTNFPTYPTVATLFGPVASPMTLGAMFKFGPLTNTEIGTGQYQVSAYDAGLNIANIWTALGFYRCYTYPYGNLTNNIVSDFSTYNVGVTLQSPMIFVEITDFNIKSYSGESSDTMKALAVVPMEQFQTDTTTGILHYQAPYSMPIELNIQYPQTYYELTARLRYGDGRLVKDILQPTTITFKIGESEESKQQRVMDKALEKLAGVLTKKQDTQISNFGAGIPLF